MTYELKYFEAVVKSDIPRLGSKKSLVKKMILKKLTTAPVVFGKPLRHNLKGCRALRIGDLRVVFVIRDKTVFILCIDHRSKIYKSVLKRLLMDEGEGL
jgi:mRNA-degrading endonuclease RelE of RelBE toxin-antitoxin system